MRVKTACPSCFGQNLYCSTCQGEGFILIEGESEKLPPNTCKFCKGKGFNIFNDKDGAKICPDCNGTGIKS